MLAYTQTYIYMRTLLVLDYGVELDLEKNKIRNSETMVLLQLELCSRWSVSVEAAEMLLSRYGAAVVQHKAHHQQDGAQKDSSSGSHLQLWARSGGDAVHLLVV